MFQHWKLFLNVRAIEEKDGIANFFPDDKRAAVPDAFFPYRKRDESAIEKRAGIGANFFPYDGRAIEKKDRIANFFPYDKRAEVPDALFPYEKRADWAE